MTDRHGETERNEEVTQQDEGVEWEADASVRNTYAINTEQEGQDRMFILFQTSLPR